MRFLALDKHYIIKLQFLIVNSPFCSHKGPNES